jgi:hypothetical protein
MDGQAVSAAFGQDSAADVLPPGPVLAALTEQAASDPGSLTDDELLGVLHAARRLANRAAWQQTVVIAEFARRRQAAFEADKAAGVPVGCRAGEFPGVELAMELTDTEAYAGARIDTAVELTARLPRTLAGLEDGTIDLDRACAIAARTAVMGDADAARADRVLAAAAPGLRPDQLARKAAALELKLAPDAVAARKELARRLGQRVEARREESGNASLSGRELDTADVIASKAHIDAVALKLRDSGLIEGSLGRLRALALTDLTQGRDPLDRIRPRPAAPDDNPATSGPAADPATSQSATSGPAADPATSQSATSGPAAAGSATSEPAVTGPATSEPAVTGSATSEPAAGPPGADAVTVEEPPAGPFSGLGHASGPGGSAPGPGSAGPCGPAGEPAAGPGDDLDPGPGPGRGPGPARAGDPAPLPALINLLVPAAALLGWGTAPGQAAGWGLLDRNETRTLVRAASRHPRTRWCVTVTAPDGTAVAHGCAPGRHPWPGNTPSPPSPPPPPTPPSAPPGSPPSDAPDTPTGPRDTATQEQAAQLAGLLQRLKITPEPIARDTCDHASAENRYVPSRKLKHLIRARNQTCTAPACNNQALHSDLDHTQPHPDGPTCQCNLTPKCRRHHRTKQAPGWNVAQPTPDTSVWTTPSGRTHTTRPTIYDL